MKLVDCESAPNHVEIALANYTIFSRYILGSSIRKEGTYLMCTNLTVLDVAVVRKQVSPVEQEQSKTIANYEKSQR